MDAKAQDAIGVLLPLQLPAVPQRMQMRHRLAQCKCQASGSTTLAGKVQRRQSAAFQCSRWGAVSRGLAKLGVPPCAVSTR